jgi:putative ABC transport system permease protein
MLRANASLVTAAVMTLALGIGATTVMFSVTYGVLVRPLPYDEADRLVQLSERRDKAGLANRPMITNITYFAWNGRSQTIGPIATYGGRMFTVGVDNPVRMFGAGISPSVFEVLRVTPALGRVFISDDAREGAPGVAVISDGLWREGFGSDPAAIGKTLYVDRNAFTIVGIAPPGFAFPTRETRFWMPSEEDRPSSTEADFRIRGTSAIARLRPGVTAEEATAEGTSRARAEAWPARPDPFYGSGPPIAVQARPLVAEMTSGVRPLLLFVLVGAASLLLIACANVANLLLSRGAAREREVAVMLALGASRGRVASQLLTESLLIALCGGAVGVVLAAMVVRILPAVAPPDFPRVLDIHLDGVVAVFAVVVSIVAGLASGLMPTARIGRRDLVSSLRTGVGTSAGRQTIRHRRLLLIAEASLAMLLLALATLVGRGFVRLMHVNPGYDAAHVLTARVFLPGAQLQRGDADLFAAALLDRLRRAPGVVAAGAGWMSPFGGSTSASVFTIAAPGREKVTSQSLVNVVTPGYAEALSLQLVAGRLLTDADLSSPRQSLVVNEAFVRTFLQAVAPIGVNVGHILSRTAEADVVGVVRNVLREGRQSKPEPEVYVPAAHRYSVGGEMKIVVRTSNDPLALAGTLRDAVHNIRRDTAVDNVLPLATQLSDSVRTERLAATTMGSFATMAMGLAAIGVYGVLSYNVSTRRREMGIRAALGADRRNLLWLVVRDGMAVTAVGLVIGLAGAIGAARWLQFAFFGVQPLDPIAFVVAPLLLAAVAVAACLLPARRAARVEPAVALRCE